MILVATAEEMKRLDEFAIKGIGIPSLALMENAGRGVVDELVEVGGSVHGAGVVVICGGGNNGGDGLVVARYLENLGADVDVFLTCAEDAVKGDARVQLQMVKNLGMEVKPLQDRKSLSALRRACAGADVIIDAMLGTGARGILNDHLTRLVAVANSTDAFKVAIDAPTGVDMNTGALMGEAFHAQLTVTFGLPKRGHFFYPGREFCGELTIVDIGIPQLAIENSEIGLILVEDEDIRRFLPVHPPDAHKGTCGTTLIIAGSEGFTGAAALAGQAALLSGSGLVHLGIPRSLNDILEIKLTEVITKPLPETETRSLARDSFGEILELTGKAGCIAVGPGLGRHRETRDLVAELVKTVKIPLVLDADGLNALTDDPGILAKRKRPTVITPHPGELGRLIGEPPGKINGNRVEFARKYANEWGVVLLLKGAPTVTAHPDGFCCINSTGNAGLASGGTGDVLTGTIASFITQGVDPFQAAVAGAYLHGLAGDVAAEEYGEAGLVAMAVLEFLPYVLENGLEEEDEEDR